MIIWKWLTFLGHPVYGEPVECDLELDLRAIVIEAGWRRKARSGMVTWLSASHQTSGSVQYKLEYI